MKHEELQHYGVLGMKWGIRKDPSNALRRSAKKAMKLQRKNIRGLRKKVRGQKKLRKAAKLRLKALKRGKEPNLEKILKLEKKGYKLTTKAAKRERKYEKWLYRMEKNFANVKLSEIEPEVKSYARKFLYMLENDSLKHYGVLGMKWGVRKDRVRSAGKKVSNGVAKVQKFNKERKAERKSKLLRSTKADTLFKYRKELSNSELQNRISRIEMEAKLSRYAQQQSKSAKAKARVDNALSYFNTANQVYVAFNSPLGKAIRKRLGG